MNGIFNKNTHFVSFLANNTFFSPSKCLYPPSRLRQAASNVWGSIQMERRYRRQSWAWPYHRSSLGEWLKKKNQFLAVFFFGTIAAFSSMWNCEGGQFSELGYWLGEFWLIKVLPCPCLVRLFPEESCFYIYFLESALCFQTHIILQTGKLTFPSASWGVEREREQQRCNHCLWRRNVLAPLSVGLWLGNTILHLKIPMVSWLYKSRSYMLQYHSHAL